MYEVLMYVSTLRFGLIQMEKCVALLSSFVGVSYWMDDEVSIPITSISTSSPLLPPHASRLWGPHIFLPIGCCDSLPLGKLARA
jgi:hypothetical protein